MISATSKISPRISILRKLSMLMWSSPLFSTPSTNRPMIVLPIPPWPPNRLVSAHHHRRDAVEQIGIELVLLRAAEIRHAQHARDAGAHRRDDHHRGQDRADIDAGILGGFAIAA